jgi:putative hemolysin
MSTSLFVLMLLIGLVLSGVFSGSETGFYSLSRSRLDVEVTRGSRWAGVVRQLSERRATTLITILIGNNLVLESMTLMAESTFSSIPGEEWKDEAFLAFGLTPLVFLFGELLPKDLFRRRPHAMVRLSVPVLVVARYLFFPLERVLMLLTRALEKLLGFAPEVIVRRPGREEVLGVLAEGRAAGVLEPHAEELARNALKLRTLPVTRAMIPWEEVLTIPAAEADTVQRRLVHGSKHTRLPVRDGGEVKTYVHQLSVLEKGDAVSVLEQQRPLTFFAPDISVEQALARMRVAGGRLAGIGTPAEPLGIVTLKDLVEEISGDLGGW